MKAPQCTTIDFESDAIEKRPYYPPKPCGVSIKRPGERKATYHAWGHDEGNTCDHGKASRILKDIFKSGEPMLFQNGKFDVDVAEVHMGCKAPSDPLKVHDTLFQLFLDNPHARSLSLKPSAERILGMKPEERDAVKDWIVTNVPDARRKPSDWFRFMARVPVKVMAPYANGDVIRTEKLHQKLYTDLHKRGMLEAYQREQRLMPVLLKNEREGVRVNLVAMEHDVPMYEAAMNAADNWLRKRLKSPNLDVGKDTQFGDALAESGVVTQFVATSTGKRSVSKKNLTPDLFGDYRVYQVFNYRNKLATCLQTFMRPWLEVARATNGRIHTDWNQVRGDDGGARTGRLSSSPNFQNIPKDFLKRNPDYKHPDFIKSLPPLPQMRTYLLPDADDHIWGRRDYNQQELRIMSHYESGSLMRSYNDNPRFDLHSLVQKGILDIAKLDLIREHAKIVNFQDIYGGGSTALSEALGIPYAMAQVIKKAKRELMPDFEALVNSIKDTGKAGEAIVTWGGREYFCEPPSFVAKFNRQMTFEYKLINYLIQGSAADCTKESMIRYDAHPKRQGRLLVSVHDENNTSAHKKVFKQEMALLREIMQSVEFDIPMLSDGEFGPNWGTMQPFKEPEYKRS